ncbi:MAG: hypothetical protein ICV64_05725 [Thermoleophilia bacterium]|nr:hypothetical protein [Thermoleophilia bacterium]
MRGARPARAGARLRARAAERRRRARRRPRPRHRLVARRALFAAENARRNGAGIEIALVRWDAPDELVARGPWELVLASDVLYERRNVELLLELLPRVVAPGGAALVADPGRPHSGSFLAAAEGAWTVERLPGFERPFVAELRPR